MQVDRPLVSLIVISFNEIDSIGECLDALIKQTYPNYEIIVYDNASSDGTPDYIAAHYPEVRLTRGCENLGFGGANNEAVKTARGKYIGFVNDDAYVSPFWLEPLVELLENDPSVGCAGAELMCTDRRDVTLSDGNSIHLSGISYVRNRGKVARSGPPLEIGSISGAAFLINRDLFISMEGFESLFFLYYEDTDLSLRMRLLGKRCVVIPGAKVYHNCESRFGMHKIFYLERNRYLSLFTLMSGPMLFLMFPSMLLFELFSWGYCLLRGSGALSSKLKAWKAVYENRHWIKERRRKYSHPLAGTSYVLQAFTPVVHVDYVQPHKPHRVFDLFPLVVGYLVAIPSFLLVRIIKRLANQ